MASDDFDDLLPLDPWANIPDEMKRENRWLVYRLEPAANNKKNKIPYDPKTRHKANDPKLGVSFEEAKAAVVRDGFSGLGFYVESPFLAIDIDGCVDPVTGYVSEDAAKIIREVNSFSEISPSGTGIHVWARGTKPGDACRRGIEIYSSKRYLTVTGVQVPTTPREVREVDIGPIYHRMLAGDYKEPGQKTAERVTPIKAITEVQSGGKALTNKIELLMRGRITSTRPFVVQDDFDNFVSYPSQSEGDAALATLLAFKYNGDAEKIDADFRVSSLYREKWNRVDYRDSTIKSAIAFYRKSEEIKAPPNTPQVSMSVSDDEDEIVEIETKLPDFPQFTGSLAETCDAMSPDIPWPFKFGSLLVHMGLARSGLDTLAAESHLQPRFYVALVAQPGRGKTAAINECNRIMRPLCSKYQVLSSVDSGPSMIDAFNDQLRTSIMTGEGATSIPEGVMAKIMLAPDELRGLFEKAKITSNSRNSMIDELLKLFETNVTGNRARGAKTKLHIENAHLAILGGATESSYISMWTGTGGASDGLQSRVVPLGIEDRKMPSIQRPPDLQRLTAVTQVLADQLRQPMTRFEFDSDALGIYDEWWRSKDQSKPSETRIDGIVKRVLIVLARTNNAETINANLVRQSIELGDFIISCRDKYNPLDSQTWCQAFEALIIQVHQRHGNLSPNMCRKLVHPERRPGGVGPFLTAWKNLMLSGILKEAEKTQRSTKYRLNL